MSRTVSEIRRWRVAEWAGGSGGGGVPRGVIMGFLWHRGGIPKRFAWLSGRGGARLKRHETVDQAHQLGRMQQGNASTTARRWALREDICRPGRKCQNTAIRVLHDVFEQIAHPADVAQEERMATQGVDRILDRNRS
jgi:hypothetical protein